MLEICGVKAGYGEMQVLDDVSIVVHEGEVVTVAGNNGAGKTTLLKVVSGLLPAVGSIRFRDRELLGMKAHRIVREGVVQVPEGRKIFAEMSVRENLVMGAFLAPELLQENLERVFALFPVLAERQHQAGGTMSGGEQQMLAIGRGLMGSPKILLLDEPGLGLSPRYTDIVFEAIRSINAGGVAVLLVEQNVYRSLEISHRGFILERGRVVLSGKGADLLGDPMVRTAFLGR